jgi:hypothetical protein
MKWPVLFALLFTGVVLAREDSSEPASHNVNARYTIESVQLQSPAFKRISRSLRSEIDSLVGQKFDAAIVGIHQRVTHKLERGDTPEHVRVVYITSDRTIDNEPEVTKVRYHHKQGWTGGMEAGVQFGLTRVEVGVQSDADELLERYAGVNAGFSRPIGERVRAHFSFEAFHQQWNNATLQALQNAPTCRAFTANVTTWSRAFR